MSSTLDDLDTRAKAVRRKTRHELVVCAVCGEVKCPNCCNMELEHDGTWCCKSHMEREAMGVSSALDDIQDVRQKAAAILNGHKLRQLEDAGLTVVERSRFEALEALYEAVKSRRKAECVFDEAGEAMDAEGQVAALSYIDYFDEEIESIMKQLEALERVGKRLTVGITECACRAVGSWSSGAFRNGTRTLARITSGCWRLKRMKHRKSYQT